MAEAIFRQKVKEQGLDHKISVDSAGTGDWHVGNRPHEGTLKILDENYIEHEGITARQVEAKDLKDYNYIIAMDASNMGNLHKLKGHEQTGEMARLLDFIPNSTIVDVPDPYFTGNFNEVYELVDEGCEKLLAYIKEKEEI